MFKSERAYDRTLVRWATTWTNATDVERTGQVRDARVNGVFLFPTTGVTDDLRVGSWLRLYLILPTSDEPFRIAGEIRWRGDKGVGVEFDYLCPELERHFSSLAGAATPPATGDPGRGS